jgi:hypothetical protein
VPIRLLLRWTAACLLVLLAGNPRARASATDDAPTYERDIKPLLTKRCTICHSRKNLEKLDISAGLALDSYEAVLAGTREHTVLTRGDAKASRLTQRLDDPDDERRMPLDEEPLEESQRLLVRRWIDAGAPRGTAKAVAAATGVSPAAEAKRPARRINRAFDVVVPTEAKAPAGLEGVTAGGAVQLALKVGPLPAVTALAFRQDGRRLAVGTFSAVVVWDLDSGTPALILDDIPGQVHALSFNRDDTLLAVGAGLAARSGSVRVYSFPEGSLVHDFPGHEDVVSGLAFSPDGRRLASASFDKTVRLWDLAPEPGNPPSPGIFPGHSDFVFDVAFTTDGTALLSVSKDRSAKRIDVATLKERRTYSDHNEDVLALAVHPGGSKFVTAGNEPQVRWWGLEDEKPASKVSGHGGPVHQLAFSGDGKRLISAGADGGVKLWDGATGVLLRTLPGSTEWQYAAALSHDGRLAAAGGWDGLVRVWDAESGTGKLRATLLQPPAIAPPAAVDWLLVVPSGYAAASEPLQPLLRWQAAGKDLAPEAARPLYLKPEDVAKALQAPPPTQ